MILALAIGLWTAGPAGASDRVYWADFGGDNLFRANLDSPGAAELPISGPVVDRPAGVALDPASGRIYWANWQASPGASISWANLDGSGGGQVDTGTATLNYPTGLAFDSGTGRLYWTNFASAPDGRISWATVDGSGGGDLDTTGASVDQPAGISIDPANNSIYWTNYNDSISRANLDGTGGGSNLSTVGAAAIGRASAIVLHKPSGRVYWTSGFGTLISFANADGSGGGGNMVISGATVNGGHGLAVDRPTGRIFWVNGSGSDPIAFAALDDGSGGVLNTLGLGDGEPSFLAILRSPRSAGASRLTGGKRVGAKLRCSRGPWAGDSAHENFYRAPAEFSFRWLRNGKVLPGQSRRSLKPARPGSYRCSVSATNFAGSAQQVSAHRRVRPVRRPTLGIVSGPRGRSQARKAGFRFRANRPSVFQCRLAGRGVKQGLNRWRRCGMKGFRAVGRQTYRGLRPGPKVLRVRARDRGARVSQVVVRRWRVIPR